MLVATAIISFVANTGVLAYVGYQSGNQVSTLKARSNARK
jgi:hypothetical protein